MRWLLVLLLVGCSGGTAIDPAPQAGDAYEVPAFQWHTVDEQAMLAAYTTPLAADQKLEGFVGITPSGRLVVVTKVPRKVDDSVACTLGHEVMHLVLGDYHP